MLCQLIYKNELVRDAEIHEQVDTLSRQLAEYRVRPGDIVVCRAQTHFGTLLAWLSCTQSGAVPLIVPFDFSAAQIKRFFDVVKIRLVLEMTDSGTHTIRTCEAQADTVLDSAPVGSVIHVTSATTGDPKLVLREKSQIEAEADRYIERLALSGEDTVLPIVPFCHSFGFTSGMLAALRVGAKIVLPDLLFPRNIIGACNRNNVSLLLGVPYFFSKMKDVGAKYPLGSSMRYVIASGGPMRPGLQAAFFERFQKPLLQQYGSTETGSLSVSEPFDDYNNVGRPLRGAVFSSDPQDDKNFLYVSSPATIGSYITKSGIVRLNAGLYRTGDLGQIGAGGKIILEGRADDLVSVAGKKVSKSHVAQVIQSFGGITAVRISQRDNAGFIELVCEYSGERVIEPHILMGHCRAFLPDYQIPKHFERVNELYKSWKTGE